MEEIYNMTFDDFKGQKRIKNLLTISILSAIKRKKSVDHIILSAGPGNGKTTIAKIIANQMKSRFLVISAPTLAKPADLISILSQIRKNDVLFIDEIQALPKFLEETLYTAMDEFMLRFIFENQENSKPVEIELPDFTLIAATTRISSLSQAFRSRFSLNLSFDPYTSDDIKEIIELNVKLSGFKVEENALDLIAQNSRKNPRNAKNLVKRIIDFMIFDNKKIIDIDVVKTTLKNLDVLDNGLTKIDLKIIEALIIRFNSQPVSLEAISNVINENQDDISIINEPFLVEEGYINRTKRGRQITEKGLKTFYELKRMK